MSILSASRLSASELNRLCKNLVPGRRPSIHREAQGVLPFVNRPLVACVGERLYHLSAPASPPGH